jgi:DNA-binding MarR family transcriptional regulator
MAARNVTRVYDKAMKQIGLRVTQFSLLAAIQNQAPTSIKGLAENLAMERTTLLRNLKLLEKEGLVEMGPEGYRRAKAMRLTAAGEAKLKQAFPIWRKAQEEVVRELGLEEWSEAKELLERLSHVG